MISPWQTPLPLEEYATSRVVVYFYNSRLCLWVPIMYFHLIEAIALYQKGAIYGMEYFIFPTDLNPQVFSNDLGFNSQVFLNQLDILPNLCCAQMSDKV